jgi:hypothetical protein
MGQSFYQGTQLMFKAMEERINAMDGQLVSLSHVLREIVGKELMRAQALHKVLMDKGLFTDADLKKAMEDMIAEAKADLEKEAKTVQEAKQKAVEILVPNTVKADSNQDPTPTPAVVPVTENPSGQV